MKAQKERLCQDVEFLTGLHPYRNYQNITSLEKAAGYIKNEFTKSGYESEEQSWRARWKEYKNIIASYNRHKSKRLIIGAHYDVCDDQPGADDNASGIAGLLETARLIAENRPEIDYRIDFVAYCLEEPPFFGTKNMGSFIHAQSLAKSKAEVIGMICYEMIGYFSDKTGSQNLVLKAPALVGRYPDAGNFIIVVGNEKYRDFNVKVHRLMAEGSGIDVQLINLPPLNQWVGMSDHRNYWNFGYDALMINDTSFIRNNNYHEITDTIDTLDFDKMTEVVNSTYRAVVKMI